MPISGEKAVLRRRFRTLRDGLEPKHKAELDAALLKHLLALPEFLEAQSLLCTLSTGSEIGTLPLLTAALEQGKQIAAPYCVPGTRRMEFYFIDSLEQGLEPGPFGILQPNPAVSRPVERFEKSLCIVPGLAFDCQGFRLGYGGGYYDRFLAGYTGVSAGLVYSCLLVEKLPRDAYDLPCNRLLTEAGPVR
ncbi:5-formyltetrahydrofolate cyclo-ligase [Oscillospiraceae bacterium MB08-C2-2]|nr:5-formyltetrahydrofolate cyclo-ligase [Oscillospiraceae bacterium MB08-C2-2]